MLYLFVLSGIQTLLFILVGNSIIEVGREMFWVWWTVLWTTAFLANLTGLWLSQTLNSIVSIYITIPLLLIPQLLLCGLVIPFEDLNSDADDTNMVPLMGEIIPSRWAFETLMTEQFTDNAYNRLFFPIEKEKFTAQYYKDIHLPEVRKLTEAYAKGDSTLKQTIENEIRTLGQAARIQPPLPDEPYTFYLDKADSALRTRAHNFTAYMEQSLQKQRNEHGAEWLNTLKQTHHNEAIEALVTGQGHRFFKRAGDRIYPQIGQIYMKPGNRWGRAPFYSHEKQIGGQVFPTYLFNLIILYFFAILAIMAIFAEIPGKYLRSRNEF
jgi:hypothetical protein